MPWHKISIFACAILISLFKLNCSFQLNYTTIFKIDNNITGTGNKLKDIAYNSACNLLKCEDCCEGPISNMTCGAFYNCQKYKDYVNRHRLALIIFLIIAPYLLIPIMWILLYYVSKDDYPNFHKHLQKIYLIYTCILLPPYGLMKLVEIRWPNMARLNQLNDLGGGKEKIPKIFLKKRNIKLFQEKEFTQEKFKNVAVLDEGEVRGSKSEISVNIHKNNYNLSKRNEEADERNNINI